MPAMNRRDALKTFAGAAAFGAFAHPAIGRAGAAPSERIRIGSIGVGRQGTSNLKDFQKQKSATIVAVCDVDSDHLAEAKALVLGKEKGAECFATGEYRRLLDRKDIDAVIVTTPDHWHALPTVDACAAGKDVYCEKPLSLTIAEGQAMVAAARKHNRVVQTGSQQRSDDRFRLACELVRSGKLGTIQHVKVGIPGVNFTGPAVPDSPSPPQLDYQTWQGPAPEHPYNEKHVHYLFRFFWDYSGGQLTNFGAHHLDITQWALGMDESGPVKVQATAEYHKDRWYEVPQKCEVSYTYADGAKVSCGQGYPGGVTFEGTKGTLFVDRQKIRSNPEEIVKAEHDVKLPVSKNHHANWLECIKSREKPICDVAIGHRSATVCHLGNIAIRTGKALVWDPAREEFVGDSEAQAMVRRQYRSPWVHPEVG